MLSVPAVYLSGTTYDVPCVAVVQNPEDEDVASVVLDVRRDH